MREEKVIYQAGSIECHGFLVYDSSTVGKRPAVLVAHAWRGQDDFAREKARALAALGYVGFAVDLYGNGLSLTSKEDAQKQMLPLFKDRKTLRERIYAAYEFLQKSNLVDASRIGAIGFCFGGLTVIELLRSGAPIKAGVSFHGLLGTTLGENRASPEPVHYHPQTALLILHGAEDPMVPSQDVVNMQKELIAASVEWQMTLYGKTVHAFTNPIAEDPEGGMVYHPKMATRAWREMKLFFEEVL